MKKFFRIFAALTCKSLAPVDDSRPKRVALPLLLGEDEKITPCLKNPNWSWHDFGDGTNGFLVNGNGKVVLEYSSSQNVGSEISYFLYNHYHTNSWSRSKHSLDKFKAYAERKFVCAA